MKKYLFSLAATLLCSQFGFSQDIITTKTGEDIQAKVIEVTTEEVRYKKFDDQTGPILTISTVKLLIIRYENGSKDIFTAPESPEPAYYVLGVDSAAKLSQKGRNDAMEYYDGRNTGATWVAITTVYPVPIVAGAALAAVCASRAPADHNLNYPDSVLMTNPIYKKAYISQAHKMKNEKLLKYFAVTAITETAIAVAAVILIIALWI